MSFIRSVDTALQIHAALAALALAAVDTALQTNEL